MNMQNSYTGPYVHVGKGWRLVLADAGIDPRAVLRRAGLPSGLFDGDGSRITLDAFYSLWDGLTDEARDPALALKLGRVVSLDYFDPALFVAACSPNMTVAAQRLGLYKGLFGVFLLETNSDSASTTIRFRCAHRPTVPRTFGLWELVFLVNLARRATRENIIPLRFEAPAGPDLVPAFEDWLGCKPSFSEDYAVTFSVLDAHRPFLTHDAKIWNFFEPMMKHRTEDSLLKATLREQVERVLMENLPNGRGKISDVAEKLAISSRSLQRQLSCEGTTFVDVLGKVRERLACHYLATSTLSIPEIGFLLGFESSTSLFRAFNRWTGSTPEAWRERARQATDE